MRRAVPRDEPPRYEQHVPLVPTPCIVQLSLLYAVRARLMCA